MALVAALKKYPPIPDCYASTLSQGKTFASNS